MCTFSGHVHYRHSWEVVITALTVRSPNHSQTKHTEPRRLCRPSCMSSKDRDRQMYQRWKEGLSYVSLSYVDAQALLLQRQGVGTKDKEWSCIVCIFQMQLVTANNCHSLRCSSFSGRGRGATGSRGSVDPPLFQVRGPHMDVNPHFYEDQLVHECCWQHI